MHMVGGGPACRDSIRALRDILPQVCAPHLPPAALPDDSCVFFQKFFWIDIYVEYIVHSIHFQFLYIVRFQMYFQLYVVGCFFIQ